MGYHRNVAIVVTSFNSKYLLPAHMKARELLGDLVSEQVDGLTNGEVSFYVAPDGSKAGWPEANMASQRRAELLIHFADLIEQGCYINWVEVVFGTDDHISDPARVLTSSDPQVKL